MLTESSAKMSVTSDFGEECPTPATLAKHLEQKSEFVADDPLTLGGQRRGIVLRVMWISESVNEHHFVGDFVTDLSFSATGGLGVDNLRTGERCYNRWEVMFPVPYYGRCLCSPETYVCIYRSYDDFVKQHPAANASYIDSFKQGNSHSRAGQTVGAVLIVEQKPQYPENIGETLGIEVGDHVKMLSFSKKNSALLQGKNLRTGAEGNLYWNTFKRVTERQICGCDKQACNCRYDDYVKSMAFHKSIANGKGK